MIWVPTKVFLPIITESTLGATGGVDAVACARPAGGSGPVLVQRASATCTNIPWQARWVPLR
eukprot:CAMPEP_0206057392 /NCGR_PEP_ID=MMETSP1466-20131121/44271_1 /ASSEMBLY_ACC=CAM_ASM_001126 /TAXON_ID=44452 /ORGANISM="Pavlova gyrans, Strain CCMP608" /LENGTH=61 /DNA_ID=CAMNT_0053432665 /DNA_START=63 /DNA_END=248 /DNA_ORIENTATION=-